MKMNLNRAILYLAALAIVSAVPAFSMEPIATPPQHTVTRKVRRHRHRIVWNPVFRPSRESMILQNAEVDRMDLPRIQDDDELEALKSKGELVEINASEHLRFDPRLDPDRRYCRTFARDFVEDLSKAYFEAFGAQIQVNSAVRTVKVQKRLRRHNRNAAPEKGELASSHLAGTTVDLQRRGMTPQQIAWMQQYMMPLKQLGLIEPEEERRQWVFHVMVSDKYAQTRDDKPAMAVEAPKFVPVSEASAELASAQ